MDKINKRKIISCLISFSILLILGIIYSDAQWAYDAGDYWSRGNSIKDNGFSLIGIGGYRGYIFPFYLSITSIFGRMGFYVINALLLSLFITMILPYLSNNRYTVNIKKEIFASLLICLFFSGLVVYPLSDIFALITLACALVFLKKLKEVKNEILECLFVFCMGVFCYLAYNTRTIYLFAGAGVAFCVLYFLLKESLHTIKAYVLKSVIYICSGGSGILVAAIPQMVMNYNNNRELSIKVPTEGLMLRQLFWGIQYQRYDTYVPNVKDTFHNAPVFFNDEVGQKLLEVMQLNLNTSWSDYFKLLIYHPIDVASIYVRHFVNYLFPCWPEIYVKNLNSSKWFWGILGFTLLFVVVISLIEKCYIDSNNLIYFILLMIPAVLIIPGAVEYRFSLPIYIFAIAQFCYNINWALLREKIKGKIYKIGIIYIIILLLCLSQWTNMLANEAVGALLI